ncbi:uncharacterized protein I206_101904 [Kwoniella pini CBS 10737]|uniref:Histone deacetylase complex subunit n=1 Tax=Kwoniella pini CBS 10737 TaxID=1296096 RepID=A0A1B9HVE1_9TREE|nr:uncharacterized protein I206_07006 [Kwoniella pini CBS 10737]OCF47228.1 hypothetical protein I206_07006 [Kwoniella pini CBS 10737]
MPRSPSPRRSRSRSFTRSKSRSPVRREKDGTPEEESLSPFLIRIFVSKGKHVPLVEFDQGNIPHRDEFQVYGWKTSTPSSIIRSLISAFPPPYRSPLARYSFRHIYVDASARGLYRSKDLTSFTGRDLFNSSLKSGGGKEEEEKQNKMDIDLDEIQDNHNGLGKKKIDEKTLNEYGFITGDLLSVSLYIPEPKIPSSSKISSGPSTVPIGSNGIRSFGWDDKSNISGIPKGEEEHWHRGQPLPPQEFGNRGRGGLSIRGGGINRGGRIDRDRNGGDHIGGGNWRGGPPLGPASIGIRGGGGGGGGRGNSRRSPDYERDHRDRDGESRRNGRSRSPVNRDRRESWSSRR